MRAQVGLETRWKKAVAIGFGLLLALGLVTTLDALSGTPAPATAPCVAPSPPK